MVLLLFFWFWLNSLIPSSLYLLVSNKPRQTEFALYEHVLGLFQKHGLRESPARSISSTLIHAAIWTRLLGSNSHNDIVSVLRCDGSSFCVSKRETRLRSAIWFVQATTLSIWSNCHCLYWALCLFLWAWSHYSVRKVWAYSFLQYVQIATAWISKHWLPPLPQLSRKYCPHFCKSHFQRVLFW